MFVRLVFVELPKTSHLLAELGLGLPVWVAPGNAFELDLLFKRDFRAGQKANGSLKIIRRSEASRAGAKVPRHQLLADFCRSVAYTV